MKNFRILIIVASLIFSSAVHAANPLDALKGMIGAVIGNTAESIPEGTWKYAGPAVTFKGDNALKNLGGAAAGAALEAKLKGYYDKAGLQNMVMTVGADSTFVMKLKKATLKGTIVYGQKGTCTLHLQGLGKIAGGKFNAQWQVTGKSLSLTFDISKLVDLVGKIAAVSGKSSLSALSKMLESYDGVYAGFRLEKAD